MFLLILTASMRPCSEWLTHQHRDTLSSIVGHPSLTSYLAIADGEATGRIKFEMTEVPL
jgi:splicing factor 3B subunit 5